MFSKARTAFFRPSPGSLGIASNGHFLVQEAGAKLLFDHRLCGQILTNRVPDVITRLFPISPLRAAAWEVVAPYHLV